MWDQWCNVVCSSELPHNSSIINGFSSDSPLSVIVDSNGWPILKLILSVSIHVDAASLLWKNGRIRCFGDYLLDFYSIEMEVSWYKTVWHKYAATRFSVYGWLSLVGGL
ncbi:hypothetical protein KFK09_024512 [Dendrobium nobile]|uniref:Uncharacterized protein n=1 Tax=Dendrobium nobile TaxID=94219 RepID=A0A8T3AE10_DENNO|nr:hypothetical protein KFK09_024512 [Dendrobium nobile]